MFRELVKRVMLLVAVLQCGLRKWFISFDSQWNLRWQRIKDWQQPRVNMLGMAEMFSVGQRTYFIYGVFIAYRGP